MYLSALRWLGAYFGWIALVGIMLWWAAQPNEVALEQGRTAAAQQQVAALQTRVASFPTATPRPCMYSYQGYGYGC